MNLPYQMESGARPGEDNMTGYYDSVQLRKQAIYKLMLNCMYIRRWEH